MAETAEFVRCASRLLAADEREALIAMLAVRPLAGVLLRGTGGVRKIRWGRGARGKRGGVRVTYCFHNASDPLCLLTRFGKNERENVTAGEIRELATLVDLLKRSIEQRP